MKVLIAEDDAPSRLMLKSLLTKWGYNVTSVADGNAAWQTLCESEHPHLVILDWMMPGIEGTEIVRKLRLLEESNPHYVIIMTSGTSENAPALALDAGADDFISKPFNHAELRARVNVGCRMTRLHENLAEKLHRLEDATETISRLARTDELTGLHNRRSFNESFTLALSVARRHDHPLSLISIDLDHFKDVNDKCGHSIGDLVLIEFANLLKEMVRVEDIASRWGGEEFIILLPETNLEEATRLADRIRSAFELQPSSAAPLAVTASFGVAQLQSSENEDALIRRVDDALYAAKREGRNRVMIA